MGVSTLTFDKAMVIRALSRSGGTPLGSYQYGPELPDSMRKVKDTGTGVGHVYIHVDGGGDDVVGKGSGRMDRSVFKVPLGPGPLFLAWPLISGLLHHGFYTCVHVSTFTRLDHAVRAYPI